MAYNVANNLRIQMPDPIGVDQLKRKNALADMAAQTDQNRNALYAQQISQNSARMKADEQEAALERVRQWAPGAIAQARAGQIAPFVVAGQQLGVIDPQRDPATVTPKEVEEFATALVIGPAQPEQKYSVSEQPGPFGSRIVTDGKRFDVVPAPQPKAPPAARGPAGPAPSPGGVPPPQKPLPVVLEKRLIDVNEAGYGARASATRYEGIASEMERVLPAAGVRAKWSEAFKEVTGSEDAITELRKNYSAVRFSAAVKNLPPGPATDRDIQLALGGFLPENANPKAVASFLRGLAKMEAIRADYHDFEAQYIADKRTVAGFAKAWQEHAAQAYPKGDAPAAGGGIVTVQTPEEAMRLPPGTKFRTPDGRTKVR